LCQVSYIKRNRIAGQWADRSMADKYIANFREKPDAFSFIIELHSPSTQDSEQLPKAPLFIGTMGSLGNGEIGYMIHPQHWGKGYATEALKGLVGTHARVFPNIKIIKAMTDTTNLGSRKVLEKCGFVKAGVEMFDNVTLGPCEATIYHFIVSP